MPEYPNIISFHLYIINFYFSNRKHSHGFCLLQRQMEKQQGKHVSRAMLIQPGPADSHGTNTDHSHSITKTHEKVQIIAKSWRKTQSINFQRDGGPKDDEEWLNGEDEWTQMQCQEGKIVS